MSKRDDTRTPMNPSRKLIVKASILHGEPPFFSHKSGVVQQAQNQLGTGPGGRMEPAVRCAMELGCRTCARCTGVALPAPTMLLARLPAFRRCPRPLLLSLRCDLLPCPLRFLLVPLAVSAVLDFSAFSLGPNLPRCRNASEVSELGLVALGGFL